MFTNLLSLIHSNKNKITLLNMSDKKIKISSNRSFGIVFFIFLFISLYPILNNSSIRLWSLFLAIIFLILGLINSKLLSPFNQLWFKFGILLGKIMSPLVMALIFFFVVTPTAIIMRIIGKDLLNLKFNNKKKSYWLNKNDNNDDMKNQF